METEGGCTVGFLKFVCCSIGLVIIENEFKLGISADTRFLAIAILMCGYIAYKD